MKNLKISIVLLALTLGLFSFTLPEDKLVSTKTLITFFSHTSVEDIQAKNTTAVSTINTATGEVVFSVPMQGFEFEKALMQKHYNSAKFLDTKAFPKAKLLAKITNLNEIDFTKDGTYPAMVKGDLTIKGVTKPVSEKGTVVVKGKKVTVQSTFDLVLADYGVTFLKGKPAENIAKKIEIKVQAEY